MNSTSQMWIVAKREFMERSKTNAFRITLVGLSVLIIVGIFGVSVITGDADAAAIGVGGVSPEGIVEDIEAVAEASGEDVIVTEYDSEALARDAIESGTVEAVLIDGETVVSQSSPSATVSSILATAAQANARKQVATELGLSDADVAMLVVPIVVQFVELEPTDAAEPEDSGDEARAVASFLSSMVLLTTIMMFGQFVAVGIVEEKQNRIVEVILSRVRTSSLLIGKVLGIGALGLLQVAALGAAAVLGLAIAPLPTFEGWDITSVGITAVLWLVFWFILGYLTYSFMYATLGATISRQEDMQSIAFIPAISIMPAYLLIVFSIEGGSNVWVRMASFVPLWSPIVMPFRINTGDAAIWEIALSIAIIVLAIVGMVMLGSRVYRGAALRTGGRVSVLDAWRSGSETAEVS
ncbi:MAG: ABC transporter permease [Actinomycetota bacterium]